jgi:repressor LexA
MFDLSKKQQEVLLSLEHFARGQGRMPSVRELAEVLGLAPATTQQHLAALARKGYVRAHGRAHGLELLPRALAHLQATQQQADDELVRIPVLGNIAAGLPLEAIAQDHEQVVLSRLLAQPGDFLLRVQGDSLIEDGILDGDLALIRPQARVEDGDIAVALLPDGTATLKHVYFEKDGVLLQPANPSVPPLRVPSVTVQGRIAGLWRRF